MSSKLLGDVLKAKLERLKNRVEKPKKRDILVMSRFLLYKLYCETRIRESGNVAIKDIIQHIGSNSLFFAMLIFSLPLTLPIPYIPGLSSIMSIPLFLASGTMIIGRKKIYLPQFVQNYTLKISTVKWIIFKSVPVLQFINKISRQRVELMIKDGALPLYGILILGFSSFIFIPLPGSNFIPSIGIVLISVGFITQDGLLCILGIVVGISGALTTGILLFFATRVLHIGLEKVKENIDIITAVQIIFFALCTALTVYIVLRFKKINNKE